MATALNGIVVSPLENLQTLPSPLTSPEQLPLHLTKPSLYDPAFTYISPYPPLPPSSILGEHQLQSPVPSPISIENENSRAVTSSTRIEPQKLPSVSFLHPANLQIPPAALPHTASHQTSPRQLPGRQAAAKARVIWSALKKTGYLSESGDDEEFHDRGGAMAQGNRKRGHKEFSESDSDSESDEYVYEPVAAKQGRTRRTGGGGGGGLRARPKKTRRAGKLAWGDKEVINGGDSNAAKPKAKASGSLGMKRLTGLTRLEAERLVYYILGKTDWEDVAAHVYGEQLVMTEHDQEGDTKIETQAQTGWTNADRLKAHWRQTLSRRLVNLYSD